MPIPSFILRSCFRGKAQAHVMSPVGVWDGTPIASLYSSLAAADLFSLRQCTYVAAWRKVSVRMPVIPFSQFCEIDSR